MAQDKADLNSHERNAVGWRWSVLTEAFRLATTPQCVSLATMGLLLVALVWHISGAVFLSSADDSMAGAFLQLARGLSLEVPQSASGQAMSGQAREAFLSIPDMIDPAIDPEPSDEGRALRMPIDPVLGVPYRIVEPFRRLFLMGLGWRDFGFYLMGGCLSLAVWSLFGGAISRIAVVSIGLKQRLGVSDAMRFAAQQWTGYFSGPMLPLIGILLLAMPFSVLGVTMRADAGVLLAAVLWIPVVVGCVLMAILALGIVCGWPLMWGTISSENSDAFDAISRAYAYSFQRPLNYVTYVCVAAVLGALGWLLAWWFAEVTVSFGYWAISWGCGPERLQEIRVAIEGGSDVAEEPLSLMLWLGTGLIRLTVSLVRAAASGFSFAFFWCAASAIYLLLRHDTDQTELDDIVFDEDGDFEFGLPVLTDPSEPSATSTGEAEAPPPA